MFYYCKNLSNLDLSSFNTNNVANMTGMFYYCKNLSNLDLSSFNTNNVVIRFIFSFCKNLNLVLINKTNILKDNEDIKIFNY